MTARTETKLGGFGAPWVIGIVCVLSIFPHAVFASASPVSEDGLKWTSNDLNGPVHVVRVKSSDLRQAGDEWIELESDDEWVATYDRAKLVVEKEQLHPIVKPPLLPKTFTCLARDPSGKIVQSFACNAERSPIDEFRQVFLYNSKGYLAEQYMVYLGEIPSLASREVYEYEGTGQKIAEREYDAHGVLKLLITFDRDLEKNTVTVYARTGEGDLWSKSRHILDDKGRRIESVTLDTDDKILSTYRMTYDSYGNWIERTSSGRGLDLREVILYEYDHWGNWTKKTSRSMERGAETRRVIQRTIEYFPD